MSNYAIHHGSGFPRVYPVLLTHVSTTVTIVSDPFNVLASAAHNTTGIIDVVINTSIQNGSRPIVVGSSVSNIVVHIVGADATSFQVNTKLNSSGANFTAGGDIYLMISCFDGRK